MFFSRQLLNGVTWGDNQFVAVGGDFVPTRDPNIRGTILTSPDGVTWTTRDSGNDLKGVTWGDNRFVAVGFGSTILTSACAGPAAAPTATTTAATGVTAGGAKLNGRVNDNGATTTVSFDYGKTTSYGTTVAATPGTINAGVGTKAVAATIGGLACNTLYHYRVKAVNSVGTSYGGDLTFTTAVCNLPGKANLLAPTGTISTATPTYHWQAVAGATWYYLWVNDASGNRIKQWYTATQVGCESGSGECTVTPTVALQPGAGQWWVEAYSPSGSGPWSDPLSFTIQPLPGKPILIAPTGTISDTTPTYQWQAVTGATWYYVWVNDASGNRIHDWYTATATGCGNGTGTCAVTPSTELRAGTGQWWVEAYSPSGYGPWSDPLSFTIQPSSGKPVLIAPTGTITGTTPTYQWQAVAGATWYYLWVNDASGNRIQQWYPATAVGCGSGTGTCTVTPSTELRAGAGQWWVEAYSPGGYGPWSDPLSFTVTTSSGWDGNWSGTTSQGKDISFTVANNGIAAVAVQYSVPACGLQGSMNTTFNPPKPITGNQISVTLTGTGSSALSYVLTGTFNSNTSASGSVQFTYTSSNLGCQGAVARAGRISEA